jgi:hypothetical protein
MSENYPPASTAPPGTMPSPEWGDPLSPPPASEQGTADVVKDQAADLGQSTVEAGKHSVGVAQEQAAAVAAEASRQGKDLLRQAQEELGEQAAQGQQRLATELLSLGDELHAMADGSDQHGVAADLARQAATRARGAGQWLGDRSPAQVVDEVQSFARRRPGAFLALALGAGLVAGRLTRGIKAAHDDDSGAAPTISSAPQPELGGQWDQSAGAAAYESGATAYESGPAIVVSDEGPAVPVIDGLPGSGGQQAWDAEVAPDDRDALAYGDRTGREETP